MDEEENNNVDQLALSRNTASAAATENLNLAAKARVVLSLSKKLSKYRNFLLTAAVFDLLALIPFASAFFNGIFAIITFLKFGRKKMTQTGLVFIIGGALDIVVSFLPVCLGAAILRIAQEE